MFTLTVVKEDVFSRNSKMALGNIEFIKTTKCCTITYKNIVCNIFPNNFNLLITIINANKKGREWFYGRKNNNFRFERTRL